MPPRRTRLKIPRMCAQGPPSYSELETNDRARLRREAALAQVSQDATYCVHYSSLREILTSQDLTDRIARYPEGSRVHIEYLHQVPADTPQDPRNLWLRKQDPVTGAVTVSVTKWQAPGPIITKEQALTPTLERNLSEMKANKPLTRYRQRYPFPN